MGYALLFFTCATCGVPAQANPTLVMSIPARWDGSSYVADPNAKREPSARRVLVSCWSASSGSSSRFRESCVSVTILNVPITRVPTNRTFDAAQMDLCFGLQSAQLSCSRPTRPPPRREVVSSSASPAHRLVIAAAVAAAVEHV